VRTATVTSSSPNHNVVIDEVTTGLILSSNRSGPNHRKAQRDCAGAFDIFPSEHTWAKCPSGRGELGGLIWPTNGGN
jgi:hypothetical protein